MTWDRGPIVELRRQFEDAAAREIAAAAPARRRRRRRRGGVVAAVALLAAGGVAVGADLISVGKPEPERFPAADVHQYRPQRPWRVAVVARDTPLPWGVGVFRGNNGQPCAIVGRSRLGVLGAVRQGVFHPYPASAAGICRPSASRRFFVDLRYLEGRSLVYGRTSATVRTMRVSQPAGTSSARVGPGGAFLFVFDGRVDINDVQVVALGAGGQRIR